MFLGRRHPTEQHEILDGICPKPGGDYQHKYLTGYVQSLAVPTTTFTDKRCTSLTLIISQKPSKGSQYIIYYIHNSLFKGDPNPNPDHDLITQR